MPLLTDAKFDSRIFLVRPQALRPYLEGASFPNPLFR